MQPRRNLSQLPNFAFSVPLAMFHSGSGQKEGEEEGEREVDRRLQDALLTFPCVSNYENTSTKLCCCVMSLSLSLSLSFSLSLSLSLSPSPSPSLSTLQLLHALLDKCGVTMDPAVMTHHLFTQSLDRSVLGITRRCSPSWYSQQFCGVHNFLAWFTLPFVHSICCHCIPFICLVNMYPSIFALSFGQCTLIFALSLYTIYPSICFVIVCHSIQGARGNETADQALCGEESLPLEGTRG